MTLRKRLLASATMALIAVILLCAPFLVQTTNAGARELEVRYRGHVSPRRVVELMASLEEVLLAVEVKEGDAVEAGTLLARLDDRLQAVAVEAARLSAEGDAEERVTALDLEEAEEDLRRMTDAYERGAATDNEHRRAKIAAARAEAAHAETLEKRALAAVSLKLEERRLDRYHVLAPFGGTIVRIDAESGAMLTNEDPILMLADLSTLEAEFHLPAELLGALEIGRSYRMSAGPPIDGALVGRLDYVDPIIDTASGTVRCVFMVENEASRLPAGFTVHLEWR